MQKNEEIMKGFHSTICAVEQFHKIASFFSVSYRNRPCLIRAHLSARVLEFTRNLV